MKRWKKVLLIVTVSTVALLWYNPAVLAQNVLAGVDLWETRPGDATFHFGGGLECPPLPADFFGPGSDPFDGVVAFQGQPLQTIPSDILGSADTIVERLDDATLPSCPFSDTVDIQIVALDLVSIEPIIVTYNGGHDPEFWDVRMCLSSETPQPIGSKTIDKDCDEGGTFTATIPIIPKFIFTRVDPPGGPMIWDYGLSGDVVVYSVLDGYWLYDDPGFNVITSPGGVLVDHDCDGVTDAAVGLGSNFYPGLQAVPCDCQSDPADYNMVQTLWQSPDCGDHGVYPPQAPAQPTIEPEIATECPEVATECPAVETYCPEWGDTYCPLDPTYCPKDPYTECPIELTLCPIEFTSCPGGSAPTVCEITNCPEDPTMCPSLETECPVIWTECPIYPTFCEPASLTLCQQIDTECPMQPTFCTGPITSCPGAMTWCPDSPTLCPIEYTTCPEGPTICPEIPTYCPDSNPTVCKITQCPAEPTICTEGGNIQTECPTDFTLCPYNYTWCPGDVPTECPMDWTNCPVIPTVCPESSTVCPEVITECPEAQTACPAIPTECYPDPTICEVTLCPVDPTVCPMDPTLCYPDPTICEVTLCPPIETECPESDTKCPVIATECPAIYTFCPEIETECPDVHTECPIDPTMCEVTACPEVETSCPSGTTWCPVIETACPTGPTWCPVDPTSCPMYDEDYDGMYDDCDNCPNNPNGPSAGSCTRGPRAFIGDPCTMPGANPTECGTNGYCSMAQEDTLPPPSGNSSPPTANCGDACECEGDFDNNGVQDGADAITFKTDFGRFNCMIAPPCKGDFDCSGVVDGQDAIKFKIDFGRFDCPNCAKVPWCPYE